MFYDLFYDVDVVYIGCYLMYYGMFM